MASTKSKSVKTYFYDHPRPALTVDIALFHRSAKRVEVLLIKRAREPFKGLWAFPGGFVDKDESLDDAAARDHDPNRTGCAAEAADESGQRVRRGHSRGEPDGAGRDEQREKRM